ncbi:MAG TPA: hypothetical protein VNI84_14125 [Pyrinomonadaceae bacterium]|nr:hypothetical protein [Pyrinomonadaceae bacterium]
MNRLRNLTAIFAFALLILGLPTFASAQWGNNRNGGYGNGSSNRNLQGTIKNLKNRSSQFERRIDRELDNSRYDGRQREDRVLQLAHDFKDATERLDRAYDNRGDYSRSQNEARRVLDLGSQLDRVISRLRTNSNVGSDWNRISQDLNVLRNAYNYNGNRRNNRNGDYDDDDYNRNDRNRRNDDDYNRNNRNRRTNNDWRRNFPFPLPF